MRLVKGNGDGTFQGGVDTNMAFYSSYEPRAGDAYDFNYDGYQDAMVSYYGSYYYFEGLGNGNFKAGSSLGSSSYTYSLSAPPRMPLGGCMNLAFDLGDDGSKEKIFSGIFNSEKKIYFGNQLNALISNPSNNLKIVTDNYGNELYEIPLRFVSDEIGSVLLHEMDVKYDYTANVELLPEDRFNLTTDLNDLLLVDNNESKIVPVYFGVYTDTPGKVTLSDLKLEFNAAPERKDIPLITVEECSVVKALNLTDLNNENKPMYFSDDYDTPSEMTYGVHSNSDPLHLELSVTEDKYLKVNTSLDPDWHGSAWARIWCQDSEGIRTVSKEFEVRVTPVDDPPIAYNPFPRVVLRENETRTVVDLDDPDKEYFIDVDSSKLYFRAVLLDPDKHGSKLTLFLDPDTNHLQVSSLTGYGQNIEIKVYCDDSSELLALNPSELELVEASQILLLNITSSTATFPPKWLPMTLSPIPEDQPQEKIMRLTNYVTDPDDAVKNLTFSIHSLSQSGYVDVIIDDSNYLNIYPKNDFDGTAKVTLSVTDDEHNSDLTTFDVKIIPNNDLPVVTIAEPQNGSKVNGQAEIIGSAYDAENALAKVEIRIGDDVDTAWEPVDGLTYWTYDLDVDAYLSTHKGANMILVKARAEDATGNRSLLDKSYLFIRKPQEDTDKDTVPNHIDRFPTNPSEWQDSDDDGVGDNTDLFTRDETQWNDTDGDGYGDNLDGNTPDLFPYDPTQWSDLDRDGHGDNPWGNQGDHYPNDPGKWEKERSSEAGSENQTEDTTYILLGLVLFVALTALVFLNYLIKYRNMKKEEIENQK